MLTLSVIFARAFNRRFRVVGDKHPFYAKLYANRYRWLQLNNLKVSPRILRTIVQKRQLVDNFELSYNKQLAVIIPLRNRDAHLKQLIPCLQEKLQSEGMPYSIFVAEQCDRQLFNRGRLMNAAVELAGDTFDYYCFHDVDLLPTDCTYGHPSVPLRLYAKIMANGDERKVSSIGFGGIVSVPRKDFIAANGFSNNFWHWGKEDDNFLLRLLLTGHNPMIDTKGRFTEIDNSSNRYKVFFEGVLLEDEAKGKAYTERNKKYQYRVARGLIPPVDEGLSTINYELLDKTENADYTHFRIKL
ncbi:MAG: hypothetical protein GY727_10480 [Gammaproteobacteria bacterium]|nr:hypothetical protein [Gammaproteobacteria bacterium]MCP4276706.1 hypothetical protein [Gammaproteobacteria bacterium]MCP4832415.1 hypothetical protein [Gammaproteobacteria bacterium]